MKPETKIILGASGALLLLLLFAGPAKAAAPPPMPPLPPPPPPPPPVPPMPPPPAPPPLPKPPTLIGDKMALTVNPSTIMTLPGGDTPVTPKPMPSNVVVKVLSIGFTLPEGKPGEWSKILVPASTAWVLFDQEKNTVGFVPSEVLGDPRMWTPSTIPDVE